MRRGCGRSQPVDVGFIVFNERNYPNLVALFDHLGVPTKPSDMSFAVSLDGGRFEYGSSFASFLAQRRNMVRPSFLRMTHDILRFNRLAPRLLDKCEDLDFTIGDFVDDAGLSPAFRDRYLVPMASCIWSTPLGRMLDYPAQTFVRFFNNHGLLTVGPQLAWRTVRGGSRSYVERIVAPLRQRARLATPAAAIRRGNDGVHVRDAAGHWDRFDKAILACHADQALALLTDADARERDLLGRFAYSSNEVWLHADATLMPRRRSVWSSWNYVADSEDRDSPVSVTYWMNRLQDLPDSTPLFVSVNPGRAPAAALQRFTFEHPMYDAAAIRAQRTLHAIQGMRDTFFCGSYCGYGFHEDALSAGLDVAEQLGVRRPWRKPDEHRRIGDPPRVVADAPIGPFPLPVTPMSRPAHTIVDATVVHRRLRPRDNAFRYRVAYLCLGLEALESAAGRWLRLDRRGLVSFRRADHGARDGSDLKAWLKRVLGEHGLGEICDGDVVLMTLPRMLGYVFNPVSFWFCRDRSGALRAVLCQVNNTFGESHCYLVHHDDRRPIEPDAWLEGRKVFHVSPFLPVEGGYRFRFRLDDGRAHVDVNYHDAQGLMLATSVGGRREALTDASVLRRFLGNPTMTLAVIVRIHWQALHLLCKRARFHRKPAPPAELVTR